MKPLTLDRFGGVGTPASAALSSAALRAIVAHGLPTTKWEGWRFTPVERRLQPDYRLASEPVSSPDASSHLGLNAAKLVLVNGRLRSELSDLSGLGRGVELRGLAKGLPPELGALAKVDGGRPFVGMNTACFTDGVLLHVGAGASAARVIHVVSLAVPGEAPTVLYPRLSIMLEAGARATLVESHQGVGAYLTAIVSEIELGEGAELTHLRLQQDGADSVHIAHTALALAANASYAATAFSLGQGLARHELHARLIGEGARFDLSAASLGGGRGHYDVTTTVEHLARATQSRQKVKCVLAGRGRGVYQGKVMVARGAMKTDAHQIARALLLSPEAEADLKPELEIFADDVKCGHGATVGELESEPLFYLRSRGIALADARRLLIEAFVGEVLDAVPEGDLRDAAGRAVAASLASLFAEVRP
ncbi:MAG: Fe-S cluster assembly protein SufD [Alphaproteobacteria bacterium]|nr:Fe-S cluster assembly protein SufD [Alphaproteobacteria bacterium]